MPGTSASLLVAALLSLSSAAAAVKALPYVQHAGKNCYTSHGGVNINNSSDAPRGFSNAQCAALCDADPRCSCYVRDLKPDGEQRCYTRAVCLPEQCDDVAAGAFATYVRDTPAAPSGDPATRNVLWVVYDDMRPDLSPYGADWMHTPHLQKLAESSVVFDRAYVQQAVCSPSRNSFATGRRPNSTRVWNFINHFRQRSCAVRNRVALRGVRTRKGSWVHTDPVVGEPGWAAPATGGFAQCCESCGAQPDCAAWTYRRGNCTLLASVDSDGEYVCPREDTGESADSCSSGDRGAYETWTTLPQLFKQAGYLSLGVGKFFHDGCGNLGGAPGDADHPAGAGKPPMADAALSWSGGGGGAGGDGDAADEGWSAVQFPDIAAYEARWGHFDNPYGAAPGTFLAPIDNGACAKDGSSNSSDFCTPAGAGADGAGAAEPLCDFVTYNDAVTKLRYAAENRRQHAQPFFMALGVRRPHLNWRAPAAYADLYPHEETALPDQRTLDPSIDSVAYSVFPMDAPTDAAEAGPSGGNFVTRPNASGSDDELRALRRHYYAAVSWADYATGVVLDELDALGLRNDTLVVMLSDHGWHLGEYAMWEKRTVWELGTRVPMMIRVPWLAEYEATRGAHSRALVEAVDVYRTVCDAMGVALPAADTVPVDGVSLLPLLRDPARATVKDAALSMHPRCAHPSMPAYGARGQKGGRDNTCLEVERTDFTWMGFSMRTDRWRYTEWVGWNGTALLPIWEQQRAVELYDHLHDTGAWTDADKFENVNLAPSASPQLLEQLSAQLHAAYAYEPQSP